MKQNLTENTDELISEVEDTARADSLPPKQERALLALLSYPTQKEAAFASGISETTLWRYMKDATFKRRLREAGSCAFSHATLRLQKVAGDAAVLEEVMRDKEVNASARVSAAKAIYDRANRVDENNELKLQLEELEEFIKTKQEEAHIDAAIKEGW